MSGCDPGGGLDEESTYESLTGRTPKEDGPQNQDGPLGIENGEHMVVSAETWQGRHRKITIFYTPLKRAEIGRLSRLPDTNLITLS
jgi:hypothetical protein